MVGTRGQRQPPQWSHYDVNSFAQTALTTHASSLRLWLRSILLLAAEQPPDAAVPKAAIRGLRAGACGVVRLSSRSGSRERLRRSSNILIPHTECCG